MGPWKVLQFDEVDSTNRMASEFVRHELESGGRVDRTAFVAHTQTAGRGRHGRSFASPPGGLYLTAVMENVPEELRMPLPLLAGLAVHQAIKPIAPQAALRWPNDIVIRSENGTWKKVAGILCEGIGMGPRYATLIGIGLNMNSDLSLLPPTATTLHTAGAQMEVNTAVQLVLEALERLLSSGHAWQEQYAAADALRGKKIILDADGRMHAGRAEGIGPAGELLLRMEGELRAFGHGSLVEVEGAAIR